MYQHVSVYYLRQILFPFYRVKETVALMKYKSYFIQYIPFTLTLHRYYLQAL